MTTYTNIIDSISHQIALKCTNVNSFANVPSQYKNGYSYKWCYGSSNNNQNYNYGVTATLASNAETEVAENTIKTQLTSFLQGRGIPTDLTQTVTPRGLLNLANNVAIFLDAHVVGSEHFTETSDLRAKYVDRTPAATTNINSGSAAQSSDIQTTITNLLNSFGSQPRTLSPKYSMSVTCCCSCSSSSSSSSSCSSSSSFFIGYMKL